MKRKVVIGYLFIAAVGIYSCQKSDNTAVSDLSSNLEIASADVTTDGVTEENDLIHSKYNSNSLFGQH